MSARMPDAILEARALRWYRHDIDAYLASSDNSSFARANRAALVASK